MSCATPAKAGVHTKMHFLMPTCKIIAVGRMKTGVIKSAYDEYARRLSWRVDLTEIDIRNEGPRQQDMEHQAILRTLIPGVPIVMLDERGKTMTSPTFATTLQKQFDQGSDTIQFVIGGADGLSDTLRAMAQHLISFGAMTWPHMLVRVMLIEQLYRAQQIVAGHPYHRGD